MGWSSSAGWNNEGWSAALAAAALALDATGAQSNFSGTSPINYVGITTAAGATLILCIVGYRSANDISSVVWDPSGANQAFTLIASQAANFGGLAVYGLSNPLTSGNKTIAVTNAATFLYSIGAASFIGTNSVLASAVPSANIVKGSSGASTTATWNITSTSDGISVGAGHMSVIADFTWNGSSSSASWTPAATQSNSSGRTGFLVSPSGVATLKVTPDVADYACGIGLDISP